MLLVAIFIVGYLAIVFEHRLGLNKSASALLTGVLCWTAYIFTGGSSWSAVVEQLGHHLGALSQIIFFLLAAMTIVEQVDAHDGFELITSRVTTTNRRRLLVTIATITFFLSAILDNLTTAILMMSLVRRLVADEEDRMYYGGVVILAANAGGAWSPIGDVTTTMLWVGEQITTARTMTTLFLPAVVSLVVPCLWIGAGMKGTVRRPGGRRQSAQGEPDRTAVVVREEEEGGGGGGGATTSMTLPTDAAAIGKTLATLDLRARTGVSVVAIAHADGQPARGLADEPLREGDVLTLNGTPAQISVVLDFLLTGESPKQTTPRERNIIFCTGVGVLVLVPVFKMVTHLPPVMGILLGLGVLWLVTDVLIRRSSLASSSSSDSEGKRGILSLGAALQRVDAPSVLFFLGILLAIGALEGNGTLAQLAKWMDQMIGNVHLITLAIGLSSSIIDNVPLVAAAQGMYSRSTFPTDHTFWLFLAYCAGTGGSILIIGSAAGIAVMGSQRISFGWYLRRLSLPALLGYGAGALVYLATT